MGWGFSKAKSCLWGMLLAILCACAGCAGRAVSRAHLAADAALAFAAIEDSQPRPFTYADAESFRQRQRRFYSQLDGPATPEAFYRTLAPLVASLGIGHTYVAPPAGAFEQHVQTGGKVLPLAVRFREGKPYTADSLGLGGLPVGAEVLTVNGQPAAEVLRRLAAGFPASGHVDLSALESRRTLWTVLWLHYGEKPLTLGLRAGGAPETRVLKPVRASDALKTLAENSPPPQWALWGVRDLPERNVTILRIEQFERRQFFLPFLKQFFEKLASDGRSGLVIDLRECGGGSVRLAEVLFAHLHGEPFSLLERLEVRPTFERGDPTPPKKRLELLRIDVPPRKLEAPNRFTGRVVVLTGPRTRSAGAIFAAAVRHYRVGPVIGRPCGERNAMHAHARRIRLPHSGLTVSVARMYVWCIGAGEEPEPIAPDILIQPAGGDGDAALDAALKLLAASH